MVLFQTYRTFTSHLNHRHQRYKAPIVLQESRSPRWSMVGFSPRNKMLPKSWFEQHISLVWWETKNNNYWCITKQASSCRNITATITNLYCIAKWNRRRCWSVLIDGNGALIHGHLKAVKQKHNEIRPTALRRKSTAPEPRIARARKLVACRSFVIVQFREL